MIRSPKPQFWKQCTVTHGRLCGLPRRGGLLVWIIPALAAIAVATLWWASPKRDQLLPRVEITQKDRQPTAPPAPPTTAANASSAQPNDSPPAVPATAGTSPDNTPRDNTLAEKQQAVIGEWTGFYQGQRRLTVREGGKATMVVEPEGFGAMLLAAKLTFEVQWTIKGDQIEFETVGGDPLDKVQVVVKMYGKRRAHKILDLQSEKIVLLDEDGVTEYIWNRVPAAASETEPPVALD